MKLLIFSHDVSLLGLAQDLENLEWSSCANFKEAHEIVSQWLKDEDDCLIVSLLDFEVGLKSIDEFSKKYLKEKMVVRIGLAPGESLKDLRSHQKSKMAAHGYLVKPLNVGALETMINDHETALFVQRNDLLKEGGEIGEIHLTKLESKALKELEELDGDKEDYDTTHPGMVLPKDFAKAVAQSVAKSEKKVSDSTKTNEMTLTDHSSLLAHFKNDPVHKKIQNIFDQVFSDGAKERPAQGAGFELPDDEDEHDHFSTNEPERVEANMSSKKEAELDIGLEFDMGEEDSSDDENKVEPKESSAQAEDDELGFDFSEDDSSSALEEVSSDDSLGESADEFSFDADDSLQESDDLSNASSTEQEQGDAGGFDLSFDDDESGEELNLGADQSSSPAEQAAADETGFDLGDEEEGEGDLNFDLGGAENSGAVLDSDPDEDAFGDLGFDDDNDADPTVLGTSADLLKASHEADDGYDNEIGEDTLDKVDKTISEIILGEITGSSANSSSRSDEDSTGDFDLPSGLPSELTEDMLAEEGTDSQEFSLDEDIAGDDVSQRSSSDSTNPTVITSTSGLKAPVKPDISDEEDLFSFDTDSIGEQESSESVESLFAAENDEEEEVQFEQSTPVAAKKNQNEPESSSRNLSHISNDELLRLQGTIRQLREEREEHLKEILELKKEVKLTEQSGLSNKAELDESKIEISILKKRHKTEIEEYSYQLKLAEERKQIFEERCKNYQKEFDRLNQKVRIEFNQVKQREKELESQLELVTMDTEAQVQARDGKILELKRKIDALEFNMENATIREQKSRDDKMRLEERLHKMMTTLRGSIKSLEDEGSEQSAHFADDSDNDQGTKTDHKLKR